MPTSWDSDGHILHDGVAITTPPKVTFGARANLTLDPADRAGPPTFDGATCSNVYCHGAVLHDAGGTAPAPRWDDPTPPGCSTRCHGQPPPRSTRGTTARRAIRRTRRTSTASSRSDARRAAAAATAARARRHRRSICRATRHDRARRRRAPGAPPGELADLGADRVRDVPRGACHDRLPRPPRLADAAVVDPSLGWDRASADLHDGVVSRPVAPGLDVRARRSRAVAATASRRTTRATPRR